MHILLDGHRHKLPGAFDDRSALGDILEWARTRLPTGRVIVSVKRDGVVLQGPALTDVRRDPVGDFAMELTSADRKELSLTMLGKLAALIEWLAPQHRQVASLLEQGNTPLALHRLQSVLAAWQQIQAAYGNLAKMLELSVKKLRVNELNGEAALDEFCRQLEEIQGALTNQDFVLLADILQYEMDGAVANWMALLEATLGVVEPVPAV
jgi:hypothetical protein